MSVLLCAISPITPFNVEVFGKPIIALIGCVGAVLLAILSNFYRTAVPQAIEEFKDDRLKSYYIAHPNVAEASQRSLALARELLSQYPTPAFIFFAIAVEVGLKEAFLKPVVQGLVHSESIAGMIAEMVVNKTGFDNFHGLLFHILDQYGGASTNKIAETHRGEAVSARAVYSTQWSALRIMDQRGLWRKGVSPKIQ